MEFLDAVVHLNDPRGYQLTAMSDSWKTMCLDLPCSTGVQVPDLYKQAFWQGPIDGEQVVIQAWKGDCPHAYRELPGGIGGEVGVYRLDATRTIPDHLSLPRVDELPAPVRAIVSDVVSRLLKNFIDLAEVGTPRWWPFPELHEEIQMRLVNPVTGDELLHADPPEPAGGYWLSRWMTYESYDTYRMRYAVPDRAFDYAMEFSVGGQRFTWGTGGIEAVPGS
jgi:hypothetical protein